MTERIKRLARNALGRDLSGERFGSLVVEAEVPGAGKIERMLLCRCDCGVTVEKRKSDVKSGKTASCGCARKTYSPERRKPMDVSGQRFGRLVAQEIAKRGYGTKWRCLCDCGCEAIVALGDLRKKSGGTVSCGCYKASVGSENAIDLTGREFGRLRVVERCGTSPRGLYWKCICSCGQESINLAAEMIGGRVVSCGCAVVDKPGLTPMKVAMRRNANNHTRRARVRGAAGSHTPEQIQLLRVMQQGRCACCGCGLGDRFHRDHKKALANGGSNDITNIELLCGPCNTRKNAKDEIAWANENGRLL